MKRVFYIPEFVVYYLYKLLQSNLQMAYYTLSPVIRVKSGFLEYPVQIRSEGALLLLCNLISMTPGTISVDVDARREHILVHVLSNSSNESVMNEIRNIERRIQRIIK